MTSVIPAFAKRRPPIPEESDYRSPLHSVELAAKVGRWLGICVLVCFLTGLWSHFVQHPAGWLTLPHRPIWIYRLTQGLHIASGIAAIPLLGMKLWVVTPKFWKRPLLGGLVRIIERGSILLLIASVAFELLTGLFNIAEFYPWAFFFPTVHYAVAWIAIGSVLVHIAVKLPLIRTALGWKSAVIATAGDAPTDSDRAGDPGRDIEAEPVASSEPGREPDRGTAGSGDRTEAAASALSRRGALLLGVGAVGTVTLATASDRLPFLSPISVLAQRGGSGPQGLPVNKSATSAGVLAKISPAVWSLTIVGTGGTGRTLTLADLQAMPQRTVDLPIACVEGWARTGTWTGVPLGDLLDHVGVTRGAVKMVSLEKGLYGETAVTPGSVDDPYTLIALKLSGEDLHVDHGYPARLIAPGRPGALQTKWLTRIEVAS